MLAFGAFAPGAEAQETSRVTWTLATVTEAAIQRAPQVVAARASLEAARAYRTYGTMPRVGNPVLSVRAMVGRPDQ
ncbi:MAG TPA: hypothetical protein VFZ61_01820, partial [Polyangiales bacterium]